MPWREVDGVAHDMFPVVDIHDCHGHTGFVDAVVIVIVIVVVAAGLHTADACEDTARKMTSPGKRNSGIRRWPSSARIV